ncbi:Ni,Fe-hydrogenase III small subunit [Paraburkholderia caballeronis]|uniref:NADH-quinone oxidoreductase subunit B family protein n=1 Tax=Paraburkholderia caballeronis TaxID=416943 RepID=UPI0010653A90|nr:NADH-quinone oxidoreductase subunit B family protein [Paraburkholderia caballeronis]TDV39405.1 Ni,Fe-hydrogenase III small subunit [Paraburkholderia caballeronis]
MWQLLKQIATTGTPDEPVPAPAGEWRAEGERIQQEILDVLGRALTIRQIDAGSCNGCELEIHALNNPYYNIEGLGIRFVASPRHADLLLITGPLALNMREAVRQAYDATPAPKLVVAAGECACTGGIFRDGYAVCGGVSDLLPVDVSIPGCPPSPADLLRGILAAVRNQRN